MHDVSVRSVGVYGMGVPSVGVRRTLRFFSGKKLIFGVHLILKYTRLFSILCRVNIFLLNKRCRLIENMYLYKRPCRHVRTGKPMD